MLTAVVAVLAAACTGAFGDNVQIVSWAVTIAVVYLGVLKLVGWIASKLLGRMLK